ncbi:cell division protein SepF 2 [Pilimelia anulata]|uniref:Cell division protein SepF n=1 Tax=Pilimelia anulata TaxID=53371 RepID=A0A8J3B964_9ACTN|nr:cell division protein SepF [Pilimelia anulata]GGJ85651.1 cell division protein SepF 2 [Pilimelia anulata]
MSAMRKAGVWLGLIEEDDDRQYGAREYDEPGYRDSGYRSRPVADSYDDEDDDEVDEPPVPRARERAESARERTAPSARVRSITRTTPAEPAGFGGGGGGRDTLTRDNLALAPQTAPPVLRERPVAAEEPDRRYQITTLHPTTYNEARTIGEHFRDDVPVIMNLTEMDEADAKRLVDFAAGLAFGLRGTIERVTNRVFLLSPANVQVTAEDKAKIAEGGFFNQS